MKRILCIVLLFIFLGGCMTNEIQPPESLETKESATQQEDIGGDAAESVPKSEETNDVEEPAEPNELEQTEEDPKDEEEIPEEDPLLTILNSMTLEQRVGQLFLVACPNLEVAQTIAAYQFGGIIFFGDDIDGKTPDSLRAFITMCQQSAQIPMFIAVDEEGGSVCRISSRKEFRESRFPSPGALLEQGGLELLLETEKEKCLLLKELGFNVNLAPVCDITTQPDAFMYDRSLRQSPQQTGRIIRAMVLQMSQLGMGSVLKHFPGYSNNSDTHVATALDERTLEELEQADLLPFADGMDAGAGAVMVSHTIVSALDETVPASLSFEVHQYIRNEMLYDGVIMTDDMTMAAVSGQCDSAEAAVLAVLAGNDMLCTWEYETEYAAVLDAVCTGRIPIDQINNSVLRVLRWKQSLGLLDT